MQRNTRIATHARPLRLHNATQCNATNAMQCNTMQCNATRRDAYSSTLILWCLQHGFCPMHSLSHACLRTCPLAPFAPHTQAHARAHIHVRARTHMQLLATDQMWHSSCNGYGLDRWAGGGCWPATVWGLVWGCNLVLSSLTGIWHTMVVSRVQVMKSESVVAHLVSPTQY